MSEKKKLLILGASGSIGTQTLNVCRKHPDELEVVGIGVGDNIELLEKLIDEFKPKFVYSKNPIPFLYEKNVKITFYHGANGLIRIVQEEEYDTLVNALVGYVGLLPTINAIEAKKDVALANKETLVMAGDIINQKIKEYGINLYPVDSEHSAIYQCLIGADKKDISRLIITASGGSFRDKTREELKNVTIKDTLNHPTWQMGQKITVDCATMMNKGFEIIEAHHLFGVDYDNIDVILHDESVIHSMVEFNDGSVLAQMSNPDMQIPIQFSLLGPEHLVSPHSEHLDLAKIGQLHFKEMDYERFPLLAIVKKLGKLGGNIGAVLTGANDEAVKLFLNKEISFLDIEKAINEVLRNFKYIKEPTIEEILRSYKNARDYVDKMFTKDKVTEKIIHER